MNTRRQFFATAPLGVMGVIAACNDGAHDATAAPAATPPVAGGAAPAPGSAPRPVSAVPADAPTLNWIPKHEELVYTFGGATPRQRIKAGTRIVTWTEDCFDGAVATAADLPSKKMTAGHDNPQTGPFFVEGAEPGDTVAVHIVKLEPARSYAVSSFGPGFGALVGNNETAMLGPIFRRRHGATMLMRSGTLGARHPATANIRGKSRSFRSSVASVLRLRAEKCARRSSQEISVATWTAPRSAPETPCTLGVNVLRRARFLRRWPLRDGRGRDHGRGHRRRARRGSVRRTHQEAGRRRFRESKTPMKSYRRFRPSPRRRGACCVQGHDWLGAREIGNVGDGRLPVRIENAKRRSFSSWIRSTRCS